MLHHLPTRSPWKISSSKPGVFAETSSFPPSSFQQCVASCRHLMAAVGSSLLMSEWLPLMLPSRCRLASTRQAWLGWTAGQKALARVFLGSRPCHDIDTTTHACICVQDFECTHALWLSHSSEQCSGSLLLAGQSTISTGEYSHNPLGYWASTAGVLALSGLLMLVEGSQPRTACLFSPTNPVAQSN